MKVITLAENNRITEFSKKVTISEKQIQTDHTIYLSPEQIEVHTVASVPADVQLPGWCYTETKGFFKDPDYVPYVSPEEQLADAISKSEAATFRVKAIVQALVQKSVLTEEEATTILAE